MRSATFTVPCRSTVVLFAPLAAIDVMTAVDLPSSARAPGTTSGQTCIAEGVYRRRSDRIRATASARAKMVSVTCFAISANRTSVWLGVRQGGEHLSQPAQRQMPLMVDKWQDDRGRSVQLRSNQGQLQSRREQDQWQTWTSGDQASSGKG